MAESGDAAAGGHVDDRASPLERLVIPQRNGLPIGVRLIARDEWYTLPDTHVFRYGKVVVDHPLHHDHGVVWELWSV